MVGTEVTHPSGLRWCCASDALRDSCEKDPLRRNIGRTKSSDAVAAADASSSRPMAHDVPAARTHRAATLMVGKSTTVFCPLENALNL
jgi:hypothetical protein